MFFRLRTKKLTAITKGAVIGAWQYLGEYAGCACTCGFPPARGAWRQRGHPSCRRGCDYVGAALGREKVSV